MGWTMSWAWRKTRDCCEPLWRRAHKRRPTISKAGKRRGCSPSLSIKPKTVGRAQQSRVLRQAHDIVHPMGFAPVQQLVSTEARITTQKDPHLWPRLPDLAHDSFHLRHAAFGPIDIGWPQAGAQHILATDDVQRQVAVMPVVAVE